MVGTEKIAAADMALAAQKKAALQKPVMPEAPDTIPTPWIDDEPSGV